MEDCLEHQIEAHGIYFSAPPSSVHLKLPGDSSPFTGPLVATSGSEVEVECSAQGGNPPPGLQWYLAGQRWEGSTEAINQETGVTVSTVSLPVEKLDHKKEIRCEVVHEALRENLDITTHLDVQCKYFILSESYLTDCIPCRSTCGLSVSV